MPCAGVERLEGLDVLADPLGAPRPRSASIVAEVDHRLVLVPLERGHHQVAVVGADPHRVVEVRGVAAMAPRLERVPVSGNGLARSSHAREPASPLSGGTSPTLLPWSTSSWESSRSSPAASCSSRASIVLRIALPIWGFFAGFAFGAGLVAELADERFLGTVLGWVLGLVFALIFAVFAYRYYAVAVVLAMAAFGVAIGSGLVVALGIDWNWVAVLVGVAIGAVARPRGGLRRRAADRARRPQLVRRCRRRGRRPDAVLRVARVRRHRFGSLHGHRQ